MTWLTISYFPGFAEDLTSWDTTIDRDGSLQQTVHICCFMPRVKRTEQYAISLTAGQLAELERLIDATNFDAISAASKTVCVDDAARIYIKVEGSLERVIDAPLFFWDYVQKRDEKGSCPELADAMRLWKAIDRLSPYRLSGRSARE